MATRLKKKTIFLLSLVFVGFFGLIQNIIIDNFSKSRSTFKKESIADLPHFFETAEADIFGDGGGSGGDSDGGSGDGSNGIQ